MRLFIAVSFLCLASARPQLEDHEEELSGYDHAHFEQLERTRLSVYEQDIINRDQGPAGMRKAALSAVESKWPKARIPILFSTSLTRIDKDDILAAMKELRDKTCIRFVPKAKEDKNFISIVKPNERICNSYVGRVGGEQVLNLGPGCYKQHVIIHELLHVLGFIHEHNRPDRDDYISINFANIGKDNIKDFIKRSPKEVILYNKEYAYNSIMHYHWNALAVDPEVATIYPHRNRVLGSDVLSDVDVQQINRHYCGDRFTTQAPRGPTPAPTLPSPNAKPTLPSWIEWIVQPDGGIWAFGCSFTGTPLQTIQIRGEDCGQRCVDKEGCDHFMWKKAGNSGVCSLMIGYKPQNAIAGTDRNRSCGIVMFRVDRKYNINQ